MIYNTLVIYDVIIKRIVINYEYDFDMFTIEVKDSPKSLSNSIQHSIKCLTFSDQSRRTLSLKRLTTLLCFITTAAAAQSTSQ